MIIPWYNQSGFRPVWFSQHPDNSSMQLLSALKKEHFSEGRRMADYTNLLVAIDLSNESDKVIERAIQIASGDISKLSIIYVVEPVTAAYPIDAYAINMSELQEESMRLSAQRLAEIAGKYQISEQRRYTAVGSAASEVRSKANEIGADLIVIGSHGTSGWKLLLGSTANKVLHGAKCDILTVRVDS